MSYTVINIVVTLLFVGFVFWKIVPARGVRQIRTPELKELLQNKDIQFIDVRAPGIYQQFHVQGFDNVPLNEVRKAAKSKYLDKEKPVVVICQTGMRSNEACKRLKRRGFKKIANVQGGISTWEPGQVNRKR